MLNHPPPPAPPPNYYYHYYHYYATRTTRMESPTAAWFGLGDGWKDALDSFDPIDLFKKILLLQWPYGNQVSTPVLVKQKW